MEADKEKLCSSFKVDDEVYAQPLYLPDVRMPNGETRNVLYVATVNNSVYAFDTDDPRFLGEMTMTTTFLERDEGTEVTILFENIRPGIRPEDNETGTRSSLDKLTT